MLSVVLPGSGTEVWLPGVLLIALVVGFLSGLFGVGGGFLLTPALRILLGVPYPIAVGSSLVQISCNSILSTYRHGRDGNVDFKLGVLLAAGALIGTDAGVRLHTVLKDVAAVSLFGHRVSTLDLVLNLLFVVLLSGVGMFIILETARPGHGELVETRLSRWLRRIRIGPRLSFPKSGLTNYTVWLPLGVSVVVGLLTGLMGVGGGFISFPLLLYVVGIPTHVAIGTSAFQILVAGAYGSLRHGLAGNLDLLLVALLIPGGFAGVFLGVKASHLLEGRRIRRYFALVVFLGAALVVWELARELLV